MAREVAGAGSTSGTTSRQEMTGRTTSPSRTMSGGVSCTCRWATCSGTTTASGHRGLGEIGPARRPLRRPRAHVHLDPRAGLGGELGGGLHARDRQPAPRRDLLRPRRPHARPAYLADGATAPRKLLLPERATPEVPAFADNTVGVFEFDRGLGIVDIAAVEARPPARRFEVYGARGSALMSRSSRRPRCACTWREQREGSIAARRWCRSPPRPGSSSTSAS